MLDLVAEFDQALAPTVADPLYRRWGGLVLTSCLLGRHVWTVIRAGQPLYPHLFVMLVANSGYGKSTTIGAVRRALEDWFRAPQPPAPPASRPPVVLAAQSITMPRLVRALGAAFPDVPDEMVGLRSRCYALLADEVGALLGERVTVKDLQDLASIYDMGDVFAKQTNYHEARGMESRARDHYMVAAFGAQPAWLAEAVPLTRFQLGLPARTHFVLATVPTPPRLSQSGEAIPLRDRLRPGMLAVAGAAGWMHWEPEAWNCLDAWAQATHADLARWGGLFEGYGVRRPEHAAKMALLFACARAHRTIRLEDWHAAWDLLEASEALLGEVARLVGANPQRPREDEVVEWVRRRGEVEERDLRAHMRHLFDTRMIGPTLEELVKAGLLECLNPDWASPKRRFSAP